MTASTESLAKVDFTGEEEALSFSSNWQVRIFRTSFSVNWKVLTNQAFKELLKPAHKQAIWYTQEVEVLAQLSSIQITNCIHPQQTKSYVYINADKNIKYPLVPQYRTSRFNIIYVFAESIKVIQKSQQRGHKHHNIREQTLIILYSHIIKLHLFKQ